MSPLQKRAVSQACEAQKHVSNAEQYARRAASAQLTPCRSGGMGWEEWGQGGTCETVG